MVETELIRVEATKRVLVSVRHRQWFARDNIQLQGTILNVSEWRRGGAPEKLCPLCIQSIGMYRMNVKDPIRGKAPYDQNLGSILQQWMFLSIRLELSSLVPSAACWCLDSIASRPVPVSQIGRLGAALLEVLT